MFRNVRYTAQQSKAIFVHSDAARQQIMRRLLRYRRARSCHPLRGSRGELGQTSAARDGALRASIADLKPKSVSCSELSVPTREATSWFDFGWTAAFAAPIGHRRTDLIRRIRRKVGPCWRTAALRSICVLTREWLDESTLRAWLSASDCVIFNYREIFTSGAAALARSYGVPLLIPYRLSFVDLQEPHPHVFRFHALDDDFRGQLERALATPSDYDLASDWRQTTSWDRVAEITASVYRKIAQGDVRR